MFLVFFFFAHLQIFRLYITLKARKEGATYGKVHRTERNYLWTQRRAILPLAWTPRIKGDRQVRKIAPRLSQSASQKSLHQSSFGSHAQSAALWDQRWNESDGWKHHKPTCRRKKYWRGFESSRHAPLGCRDEQHPQLRGRNRFAGGGIRMRSVINELWHGNIIP